MGIARGALVNLVGLAAPLPLALLVVPDLLRELGDEQFALLTLCWALSTYASVLDLGLGRALTQKLSTTLAQGAPDDLAVGGLCSTALLGMAAMGTAVGLALFALAPLLVDGLQLNPAMQQSAAAAFKLVVMSVPFVVVSAGFRGALEAMNAFGRVNAVRLPLGIWTFVGPWLSLQFGAGLEGIAWALWGGRFVATCAWAWMAWRLLPGWRRNPRPSVHWIRPLVRSGGWLTVGNLVGPLMGYADRFLIALLISAAAATHYATPQELVSKLWVLPGALMGVMFPALARRLVLQDPAVAQLCAVALRWLMLTCLPISLGLGLGAHELLELWLGPAHAGLAAPVLRWMALGMFLGCVAQLPFTVLQGGDAASVTAKLHLLQLPLFLASFTLAALHNGIAGAAAVWALRNGIDAVCLFVLGHRRYPHLRLWARRELFVCGLAALTFIGMAFDSVVLRLSWWLLCSGALLVYLIRRPADLRFPSA